AIDDRDPHAVARQDRRAREAAETRADDDGIVSIRRRPSLQHLDRKLHRASPHSHWMRCSCAASSASADRTAARSAAHGGAPPARHSARPSSGPRAAIAASFQSWRASLHCAWPEEPAVLGARAAGGGGAPGTASGGGAAAAAGGGAAAT